MVTDTELVVVQYCWNGGGGLFNSHRLLVLVLGARRPFLWYNKLVINIKEIMTMNDDKSRHSWSGCHVAVGDVALADPPSL